MAAPILDVFLNQSMVAFLDKDRTVPYQPTDGCIGDEGTGMATNLHPADCSCTDTCNIKPTAPLPVNEGFTKAQTHFLIHLMKVHLEVEGGIPVKSLDDLNRRLRLGKKPKKLLWEEMTGKLAGQFKEDFQTDKVARKWLTLVERYEKVKQKNVLKEKRPFRFQFYREMDELLGGDNDVEPPGVKSDCAGVVTGILGALRQSNGAPSPALSDGAPSAGPSSTTVLPPPGRAPTGPSDTLRLRNRKRMNDLRDMTEDDLLAYLERSDAAATAASQRRHEDTLSEMRALREDQRELLQLFSRMVDKM
ncbi:uncharacterized protein LOC132447508 isoform X1 [Gadus macrocephalus]|uniref:uncharacterized protein LOC132447508 isoform X1 n=2 Tax=Gadus macrocephalus TaxID=80720 RepID=UPI0028CB28E8|nr:uncharacterized protein LOC132447508 isoform X1 [Gadus macrocephalus]